MSTLAIPLHDSGLEVIDILGDHAFVTRAFHKHNTADHMAGMRRIAHAFVESPETILQELVNAAVDLCGADSAGISIVRENPTDEQYFQWIAIAGQYSPFLDAILPRNPSACSVTLQRGRPQRFRVDQRFFDIMGIDAPLVTDGILLPWQIDETRGTIFVMAHGRSEAFDAQDYQLMQMLADFAAMGVRQRKQQKLLLEQTGVAAANAMAHNLAHRINNPLQSLTNILYLAAEGHNGEQARDLGKHALEDLQKLSTLVSKLLDLRL